jgi:acetolactate synthase-1/2/3 large subunit
LKIGDLVKLSDYVIDHLASEGITHIFEVAGGSLAHLLDAVYGKKNIKTVSMHHEMAAAIAAEGYARTSGNLGVAMATSGPGATNLITGIGSCFFDSIPCIFITGQVNTYEFKFKRPVRQVGFQETDIVRIVKPIVKDSVLVANPKKIKYYLEKAVYIAKSGRPGPVLLDIPLNIQRADIEEQSLKSHKSSNEESLNEPNDKMINQIIQLLKSSFRPVVLVGGGGRISKAEDELFQFIHKTKIPLVTSLMGLDIFPHSDQSFVGMIGTYGNRYANLTIANSDLVIALGTRLDTRQTGTKPETFAREAKIIHIDIDSYELNNKIRADLSINCDLKILLSKLLNRIGEYDSTKILPWIETINRYKARYPSYNLPVSDAIEPNYFIHKLSEFVPENSVICVDVGQNQMWAAQSFEVKKSQRFLTEGGMASMGSALPMAIGASFAKPNETIVVITGDGGFQLNIQELQTIYHHNLPIKIIMLNNRCYGMIRQFQEQYFNCRYQSTGIGYSSPDFQDVVSAYKIHTRKINKNIEIEPALQEVFSDIQPMFLEVTINPNFKALPKLSVDKPIEDQDPLLSRDELKSNMVIKFYKH